MSIERDNDFGKDRISGLPDDIILNFLSGMTMKEAAKTSIVSKRWRYLWAWRTHLDFDHFLVALPHKFCVTPAERGKYINWVNQVVGLHCSPCIDTFRVCFDFLSSDAYHFDKWVRFALLRKVKNLHLSSNRREVVYTLGFDILKPSVGVGNSGITSLASLHLRNIDVSGDFIEFLLSKCHHLERLHVECSSLLVRLKVIGLSCKLKQLTIRYCDNLEELEIDALNLMSLDYMSVDNRTNLVFKRMPMLVEAAFGTCCFASLVSIFPQISHLPANIYKLSQLCLVNEFYKFPDGALPTFFNLRQLNMRMAVIHGYETNPFDITPLLEACPMLHELKFKVYWFIHHRDDHVREAHFLRIMDPCSGNDFEVVFDKYFDLGQIEPKIHPNLKLLEVVGYSGCNYDVNIILSVIRSAKNLEAVIIDPNHPFSYKNADVETSRARAYKIRKFFLPKIRVVII